MTEKFTDPKIYFKQDEPPQGENDSTEVRQRPEELFDVSNFFKYFEETKKSFERHALNQEASTEDPEEFFANDPLFKNLLEYKNFIRYEIGVLITDLSQRESDRDFYLQPGEDCDESEAKSSEVGMYSIFQEMDIFLRMAKHASPYEAYAQTNKYARGIFRDSVNQIDHYKSLIEDRKSDEKVSIEEGAEARMAFLGEGDRLSPDTRNRIGKYMERINKFLSESSHS